MISLLEYMDDEPSKESMWATAHHLMLDLQRQDALIMREALARATRHKSEPDNPLAAMCAYSDAPGLTDRLPTKRARSVFETVAPMVHKFGGWGA